MADVLRVGSYRLIAGPQVYTSGDNVYDVWLKMSRSLPRGSEVLLEGISTDSLYAEPRPPGGRAAPRCYSEGVDNTLNTSPRLTAQKRVGGAVEVTVRIKGRGVLRTEVRTERGLDLIRNPDGVEEGDVREMRRLGCAYAQKIRRLRATWDRCRRAAHARRQIAACDNAYYRARNN